MPSYKAQQFIDAIPGTAGIIDTIAKRVGCDWHTAKKYIQEYATVKEAYDDETERVADLAVTVIIKAIREGDIATAKWYLTKKRKGDFGDAIEVSGPGGGKIIVSVED
jgi:hypothetical protein